MYTKYRPCGHIIVAVNMYTKSLMGSVVDRKKFILFTFAFSNQDTYIYPQSIMTLLGLNYCNGLFRSLFLINLKSSVGMKAFTT